MIQVAFAIDQIKALVPNHPELKTQHPFKGPLAKDMTAVAAAGEKGRLQIMAATHTGMTTDEFSKSMHDWLRILPEASGPRIPGTGKAGGSPLLCFRRP